MRLEFFSLSLSGDGQRMKDDFPMSNSILPSVLQNTGDNETEVGDLRSASVQKPQVLRIHIKVTEIASACRGNILEETRGSFLSFYLAPTTPPPPASQTPPDYLHSV